MDPLKLHLRYQQQTSARDLLVIGWTRRQRDCGWRKRPFRQQFAQRRIQSAKWINKTIHPLFTFRNPFASLPSLLLPPPSASLSLILSSVEGLIVSFSRCFFLLLFIFYCFLFSRSIGTDPGGLEASPK